MKGNNQPLDKATEAAFAFLCKRRPADGPYSHERMEQYQYVMVLMEFQDKKGDDALKALAGFYCWMIDNKKGDDVTRGIIETFNHDLSERNDQWSLPRSSSYGEYWQREMERIPQRSSI